MLLLVSVSLLVPLLVLLFVLLLVLLLLLLLLSESLASESDDEVPLVSLPLLPPDLDFEPDSDEPSLLPELPRSSLGSRVACSS